LVNEIVGRNGVRSTRSPFLFNFSNRRPQPNEPTADRLQALALNEYLKRAARTDIGAFTMYAMRDSQNQAMKPQWFHMEWNDAMDRYPRLLIMSPRCHAKTECISVIRVIHELGRNPNLRVKVVAQSDDKASVILQQVAANILNNLKIREVFPTLRPMDKGNWSKHRLMVQRDAISKDPSLEALGVLSSGTGGRADLIVFDDICDFRNTIQQPSLRETVKEAYKSVWVNLLEPEGRIAYISTPWHCDDQTHELLANDEYHHIVYKIADDPNNPGHFIPIWDYKWPDEALVRRRNEIGPREFSRQFQMQAISSEEQLFSFDKLRLNFVEERSWPSINDCIFYAGLDLAAFRKKSKVDRGWNVIFIIGVDKEGRKWPFEVHRFRATAPDVTRKFKAFWDKYQMVISNVENNAYQQSLIEWINELYNDSRFVNHVQAFVTSSTKSHPETGLPGLALEFDNRKWAIPVGEKGHAPNCTCSICQWLGELVDYPIGRTTDALMASWFASSAVKQGAIKRGGFEHW